MVHTNRQHFPVGDTENGQWVQIRTAPVEWVDWLDYEDLTVSSTALGLTKNDNNFDRVMITVEVDAIRFKLDGNVPTAALGVLVAAASAIELESAREIKDFRVIRVTNDSTLRVHYGRTVRDLS